MSARAARSIADIESGVILASVSGFICFSAALNATAIAFIVLSRNETPTAVSYASVKTAHFVVIFVAVPARSSACQAPAARSAAFMFVVPLFFSRRLPSIGSM